MNLKALQHTLMAIARAAPPDARVPYAFEKRIMARLGETSPLDVVGLWGRALWRATVPCVTVTLLLCVYSLWQGSNASVAGDFTKEFETAVLISSDQPADSW